MMLKYLHNIGKITLDADVRDLKTMAVELYSYMKNTDPSLSFGITDTSAKKGIVNFGNEYANKALSFGAAFDSASVETVKGEIDSNYPVVLMFDPGVLYTSSHATTMYGYKTVTTEVEDGLSASVDYVIVKDPAKSSVPTVTLAWTKSNIYGYFILYVK